MKILIVDDEVVIRKGIIKLLEQSGGSMIEIDEARNGEEALMCIGLSKPDMILTDIQMPVMDGLQLIARVRERHPDMAIVVLSGYAEFQYVQQALRHQVSDYLLKPVTAEMLQEVISRVLLNDPSKWMASMDAASIRLMKDTVAMLVKSVMAENKTECDALIDAWGAHLQQGDYSLLEMKRIMGHFGLAFRAELLLVHKRSAGDEGNPASKPAAALEDLLRNWKDYISDIISVIADSRAPRNKRVVEDAIAMISREYGDATLNLSMLAEHDGLSTAYLSKIFREVMKKPITQYISEFRLEKARELLLQEESAKINLIAEQCGFNDYPYFSKIFKKYYGVPPLEYKEKNSSQV